LNATALVVTFLLPLFGATSVCTPRVARGARLADVRVGRRRSPRSRSGRNATLRRVPKRCVFLRRFGRTELSQALLDHGRLLRGFSGRFEDLVEFLAPSRREDVAWSGGDAVPWMVFAFFAEVVVLASLHCSLACACGAAVGPFVLDCETER
ncbi:hypothetical protein Taro_032518, partial [Colocasia esculenta]|nr:hypothetical protein [Colocasia esculenta]